MSLAFKAMEFARQIHANQKRKYTGNPYADHLAEVAGIVATVEGCTPEMIAVAWLHDCVEDQHVDPIYLGMFYGPTVKEGVMLLSDLEEGNRESRKRQSRERLAKAPGWVQSIKCADLISNTSSIVQHDPKFAVTYLQEKRLLLDVLTKADPKLREMAMKCAEQTQGGE